jgi:hypothetical protein
MLIALKELKAKSMQRQKGEKEEKQDTNFYYLVEFK